MTQAWPTALRARPLALLAGAALAVGARLVLLPTSGLPDDLDQFAAWVSWLAGHPLADAYRNLNLSFPPVMAYLWDLMGILQPAFRTATDSSDLAVRITLKLPGILADIALALGVAWHLRSRPSLAAIAGLAVALHPAVLDVSAWWGQYESIYTLFALAGFLLAVNGRPSLAAVALGVCVMTKPQAIPVVLPFVAWLLARRGLRGSIRPAVAGLITVALLWLPFLAADGPLAYLRSVQAYQDGPFAVLSLRAWNPWWILQAMAPAGGFVPDSGVIAGPVTFRVAGLLLAGLLELVVLAAVYRRPTPTTLAWGIAASTLVAFTMLTTMHERYAYPALIFLVLAFPDRRAVAVWLALSVAITLNLWAAVPPTPELGRLLPVDGVLGIAGSLVMTGAMAACLLVTGRPLASDEPAGTVRSRDRGGTGQPPAADARQVADAR